MNFLDYITGTGKSRTKNPEHRSGFFINPKDISNFE